MPNHYHTLLRIRDGVALSKVIHATHSSYVHALNRREKLKQRIWARRTWDEWIRSDDMYWQKAAYILLNPWRAKLVRYPLDPYAFSSINEWRRKYGEEFLLDLFGRYARYGE